MIIIKKLPTEKSTMNRNQLPKLVDHVPKQLLVEKTPRLLISLIKLQPQQAGK